VMGIVSVSMLMLPSDATPANLLGLCVHSMGCLSGPW